MSQCAANLTKIKPEVKTETKTKQWIRIKFLDQARDQDQITFLDQARDQDQDQFLDQARDQTAMDHFQELIQAIQAEDQDQWLRS